MIKKAAHLISLLMPGMLVAATGVGAGDLATASFTGNQLGLAILWAVVVGGILKFVLTEGLARWQLVTGQTFIQGVATHYGLIAAWLFMPYLLVWTFFVASALINACGVSMHAILPIYDSFTDKLIYGIISSLAGFALVMAGGFKLFEKIMTVCIGIMFITVLVTAILLWPGTSQVVTGLFVPVIPDAQGKGIVWTVALIGGVGGTVTILCYGYWIKELGRTSSTFIKTCRIDLASGYLMTILFGIAMVIIGNSIEIEGHGAGLLIALANSLEKPLGLMGRWLFLIGAFCAIFSSLLGVWQATPYLFADSWHLFLARKNKPPHHIMHTKPYRYYLIAITFIPMLGLFMQFKEAQKLYALIGALFIPLLAITLLMMNSRKKWLGKHSNGLVSTLTLIVTLLLFLMLAFLQWDNIQ